VTLGCARNEVDSEELAARLEAGGWTITEGDEASVVLVNTCGFIEAAKQESIDELLGASSSGAQVVAAGCLAERYGAGLAEALPEAQVLSFDDYGDIAARLDGVLAGQRLPAHQPRDRRRLLPLAPAGTPFQLAVWHALQRIGYGRTTSYGQLARDLGNVNGARAVGLANGSNPLPVIIPCHRVIGADGSLTGFGGGLDIYRSTADELERIVGLVFDRIASERPRNSGAV